MTEADRKDTEANFKEPTGHIRGNLSIKTVTE